MRRKVLQTIREYEMLRPGDRVTVAFSGGADSTALLCLLWQLREQLRIEVAACHINHQLRGQESQRDEDFVRTFCERHGIPLTVERIDAVQGRATGRRVGRDLFPRGALPPSGAGSGAAGQDCHRPHDGRQRRDGFVLSCQRDGPQRSGRHPAGARADYPPAGRLYPQGGGGLLRAGGTPLCHRQHQPQRRIHPQPHPPPHACR